MCLFRLEYVFLVWNNTFQLLWTLYRPPEGSHGSVSCVLFWVITVKGQIRVQLGETAQICLFCFNLHGYWEKLTFQRWYSRYARSFEVIHKASFPCCTHMQIVNSVSMRGLLCCCLMTFLCLLLLLPIDVHDTIFTHWRSMGIMPCFLTATGNRWGQRHHLHLQLVINNKLAQRDTRPSYCTSSVWWWIQYMWLWVLTVRQTRTHKNTDKGGWNEFGCWSSASKADSIFKASSGQGCKKTVGL